MAIGRGDVMRWKQIEDEPKTLVVVLGTGDEIASGLLTAKDVTLAHDPASHNE
jgi:hypothetical protein